jgi:hypothetical protein
VYDSKISLEFIDINVYYSNIIGIDSSYQIYVYNSITSSNYIPIQINHDRFNINEYMHLIGVSTIIRGTRIFIKYDYYGANYNYSSKIYSVSLDLVNNLFVIINNIVIDYSYNLDVLLGLSTFILISDYRNISVRNPDILNVYVLYMVTTFDIFQPSIDVSNDYGIYFNSYDIDDYTIMFNQYDVYYNTRQTYPTNIVLHEMFKITNGLLYTNHNIYTFDINYSLGLININGSPINNFYLIERLIFSDYYNSFLILSVLKPQQN